MSLNTVELLFTQISLSPSLLGERHQWRTLLLSHRPCFLFPWLSHLPGSTASPVPCASRLGNQSSVLHHCCPSCSWPTSPSAHLTQNPPSLPCMRSGRPFWWAAHIPLLDIYFRANLDGELEFCLQYPFCFLFHFKFLSPTPSAKFPSSERLL